MSFDLQSAWDSDPGNTIQLPDNINKLKPANLPLDAIRKNMRHELWVQVIAIISIGFFPKILNLLPVFNTAFYYLYTLLLAVSFYYLSKLFFFYKRIRHFDNSTKDGLYEMYYDIRLTIETYRTFTFSLTPFLLLLLGMFFAGTDEESFLTLLNNKEQMNQLLMKGILLFFTMFISIIIVTELWIHYLYNKHVRHIKKILDELRES